MAVAAVCEKFFIFLLENENSFEKVNLEVEMRRLRNDTIGRIGFSTHSRLQLLPIISN